jgi:thymidylate kinase
MKRQIICFEGLPGSGKTTLINMLKESNPEHIFVIPEILGEISNEDLNSNQNFYYENDKMKFQQAFESSFPYILIDRGPISTLVYNYGKSKITGDYQEYHQLMGMYFDDFSKSKKFATTYVYIKTDISKSNERVSSNIGANYWGDKKSLEYIDEAYLSLIKVLSPESTIFQMNSNDKFLSDNFLSLKSTLFV